LDHDCLRPESLPVAALQDIGLGALDVDFQEIDLAQPVRPAQIGERDHRHLYGPVAGAERGRRLGMLHAGGRETMESLEHVEVGYATLRADYGGDRGITRPQPRIKIDEFLLRLDGDALPAALVEKERHVVRDRVPGADVDVGAIVLSAEGEPQMRVL